MTTGRARARGCLLGLAAGNVLGLPAEPLGTAQAIRERFPDGLREVIRQDTPASPHDDDVALALIQAEELLQPDLDLQRLVRRWIHWRETDGRGLGETTRASLDHIARHDSPPASLPGLPTNGSIPRSVPIALATASSPRNLVSGTWHLAMLLHPDPRCAWSAVAVNAAIACLLQEIRDFIPEVLDMLRQNSADPSVMEAVRQVPLLRREEIPLTGPEAGSALVCLQAALWCGAREPKLERGLEWLANAGGDTDTNAAVAGAVMGARDGEQAIPARWLDQVAEAERIGLLAEQLVTGRAE